MFNTKASDRSTWIIQREYQDFEGIVQTEYLDSLGNTHIEAKDPNEQTKSYESGYVDGALVENHNQNEQLKRQEVANWKVSRGLLVSLIIAGVVGITGAMAYYLFQVNSPNPITVVTTPIYQTKPVPSPSPAEMEKSLTNITPAPPAKSVPQDLNVTITTQSEASKPVVATTPKVVPKVVQTVQPTKPVPTAVKAPAQSTPAIATPSAQAKPMGTKPMASIPPMVLSPNTPIPNTVPSTAKTDFQLKGEITREFNQQFSNSQLLVDVNQGNVKISGTVATPEQLEQIQPLLRSMEGVKTINVEVTLKISSK
ncbi:BON domain-containing protein [Synechocystis sp. B12]|nr:BON domain-containing protein [Synechocystis sp. B12]